MTLPRSVQEGATSRLAPLARLPVFLAMAGRRAIVVGGSAAAAWKAELLSASGARVEVFAEEPSAEILALAAEPPGGAITIHRRALEATDCEDVAMAVAAIEDEGGAERFAASMRSAGVPLNVIDKPHLSDFTFGAIVNRSPLVVGISTDGSAPAFAQAIRARIERLLPRGFADWAEAARSWRPRLRKLGLDGGERRRFWERFADLALARADDRPREADLERLIAQAPNERTGSAGAVVLVEAAAREPELMTLRALRALQSADVIITDRDVAPDILDFARREARKMMLSPASAGREAMALMLTFARAGRRVVRLASDPSRARRELAACRGAGIAVTIVPGLGAGSTAPDEARERRPALLPAE